MKKLVTCCAFAAALVLAMPGTFATAEAPGPAQVQIYQVVPGQWVDGVCTTPPGGATIRGLLVPEKAAERLLSPRPNAGICYRVNPF